MEPGQTIYFPRDDYSRASIHVTLSRLRREYKDLMGGTQLPGWSLDIPEPPGDLWAVTYHGLTEGGRVTQPRARLAPDEAKRRRRDVVNRYRARRLASLTAGLMERSQHDSTLRLSAEAHYVEDLASALRQQILEDEQAKAARKAALEERKKDPNYVPKPFVWNKSPAALARQVEREELQAKKRAERAEIRKAKAEERERMIQSRNRPPTAMELQSEINKLEISLAFYQERQEQLEAKLEDAEDAQQKAKQPHQLSPEQYAKIRQGLATSRWERAQKRIEEYSARLDRYQDKINKIEASLKKLRAAHAHGLRNQ
jgi:hypothetical protein